MLYLMMQRTSAAAAPASAGDGGGGGQTQLKQAPLPSVVQVFHVIKSDVDNLELRLGIVDGVLERQASASIHLSLKNQVLCEDPCAAVWLPVCSAWSLCGMQCADLCGLVAFARCECNSAPSCRGDLYCGCKTCGMCVCVEPCR